MPKPKSKDELIKYSHSNFKKLNDLINGFSEKEKMAEFPKGTLNRNIRDVLAHVHHWHLLLLGWYKVGMAGAKPDMPAKGYTWKTTPGLNLEIREKYNQIDIKNTQELLGQSFSDVQKLINIHTEEELFEKKRYKWTGSTSLGAYLISATSSHYEWAYKLIKKAKK